MENRIKFADEFARVTDYVTMLDKDEKTPTGYSVWVGDVNGISDNPKKYFLGDNAIEADFFATESDAKKAINLVRDVLGAVDEYRLHNGETDQLPDTFSTFKNPFGGYNLEFYTEDKFQSRVFRFENQADAETAADLLKFAAKLTNPETAQVYLADGARVIVKSNPADDEEITFLFNHEYSASKAIAVLKRYLALRRKAIEEKSKEVQA